MCYKLAFFSLMMTFLSLWVYRSAWIWGGFLTLSFILAVTTGAVQPFSVVVIGILLGCFWLLKKPVTGFSRFFLVLIGITVGLLLSFHIIPGFNNWKITEKFFISYDKPLMGLFPLVFLIPLVQSRSDWYQMALKAIPLTLVAVVLLMILTLSSGTIGWNFKLPSYALLRITSNLFLTVIPEEAFYRGFIQNELFKAFGKGLKGNIGAILFASSLFALAHLTWTGSFAMIGFVFLAGIIYGMIYQLTQRIESSIICHFIVNLLHMTCFTYHAE
jgi:membrane protease YdiL (CAAX protease family)